MKTLVTGGCSFSELSGAHYGTWPTHLSQLLPDYQHIATGVGSQGNGLISRRIIYTVTEVLKTTAPEDILVGIMWSGPDRYDFFKENVKFNSNIDTWVENPTGFVKDADKNWIIVNHSWRNEFAKKYYSTFHSTVGSVIYTYEHILRVQWFLKLHGIRCFMTAYTSEVLHNWYIEHHEVKYLRDQIDLDQFLPVRGEEDWCRDDSGIPFDNPGDFHPNKKQHKAFTDLVIVPFLQNKNYI